MLSLSDSCAHAEEVYEQQCASDPRVISQEPSCSLGTSFVAGSDWPWTSVDCVEESQVSAPATQFKASVVAARHPGEGGSMAASKAKIWG